MDFDNRKVYGDTSITDGLVFTLTQFLENKIYTEIYTVNCQLTQ